MKPTPKETDIHPPLSDDSQNPTVGMLLQLDTQKGNHGSEVFLGLNNADNFDKRAYKSITIFAFNREQFAFFFLYHIFSLFNYCYSLQLYQKQDLDFSNSSYVYDPLLVYNTT
ncbi:hypothetical protein L6452_04880 [Arctium lappa]|uniref:Uncharacterized protein n=1 Tax=Arctium lappa TaxID=4217 RepID=A0ACB9EEF7_ARCLA|nr:hypothetical protein L6452_04880 [Arctium lappa]